MSPRLNPALDATLLSRIEDAGLNASAPPQQRWIDGWLVRASPGKAKRARCVNAVSVGRGPLVDRLAACAEVFAQAKLPMIVRITPFTEPHDLDRILERQGLHRFDDTCVLVRSNLPDEPPAKRGGLTIQPIGLDAFAQRVGQFRGSPLAQRQAHAERLQNSPVPFHAFELRVDGQAVACGQIAVEGALAGLYDVFTIESARGRGYAGALCEQLLAVARGRGARHAYLQVDSDNRPALAVYARLGFVEGYSYHYRALNPAGA